LVIPPLPPMWRDGEEHIIAHHEQEDFPMSDQDQTETQDEQESTEEDAELSTDEIEDVAGGGCMTFVDSVGCSLRKH